MSEADYLFSLMNKQILRKRFPEEPPVYRLKNIILYYEFLEDKVMFYLDLNP